MSSRIDQINSLLIRELAQFINQEVYVKDTLITISFVDCSPDLAQATIGISVLPENRSGSTLTQLKKSSKSIAEHIRKKTKMKMVPKLRWKLDMTESKAAEIEDILEQIRNEK
jgi:ribosome-binding factor A